LSLRVIGAGFARTGTNSLKVALEQLLDTRCYHMWELLAHEDHAPVWTAAARGELPDWDQLLAGYGAAVDFPAAAFWPELMDVYPDAFILLSYRDTEGWWKSCSSTAFPFVLSLPESPVKEMILTLWEHRFISDVMNESAAKSAFEAYNDNVRSTVPSERLIEWQPSDGWAPICDALGLPVPEEVFPHVNTSEEFIQERFSDKSPD